MMFTGVSMIFLLVTMYVMIIHMGITPMSITSKRVTQKKTNVTTLRLAPSLGVKAGYSVIEVFKMSQLACVCPPDTRFLKTFTDYSKKYFTNHIPKSFVDINERLNLVYCVAPFN